MRKLLLSAAALSLLSTVAHARALTDTQSKFMGHQLAHSQCERTDNDCKFKHGKPMFLMQADDAIKRGDAMIASQKKLITLTNKARAENKENLPPEYYDLLVKRANDHIAQLEQHKSELNQAKSLVSSASSQEQLQAAVAQLQGKKAPQQTAAPAKPAPVAAPAVASAPANVTRRTPITNSSSANSSATTRRQRVATPYVAPVAATPAPTPAQVRRVAPSTSSHSTNTGSDVVAGEAAKDLVNSLF